MQWGLSFQQILEEKISGARSESKPETKAQAKDFLAFESMEYINLDTAIVDFQALKPKARAFGQYQDRLTRDRQHFDNSNRQQPRFGIKFAKPPWEHEPITENRGEPEPQTSSSDRPPGEDSVCVADLTALGSVAFRTLQTLSDISLPLNLTHQSLVRLKRQFSKQLHPDLGGNQERFMTMLEAVRVLEDELAAESPESSRRAS